MKRYGQIDLAGNQMVDVLFEVLASAPSSATGRVYFNSTDAVAQVYDGVDWVDLNSPDDDFYNNLANEGTPDGNDSILIYDNTAVAYKRQTRDNFFSNITGYLPAPVAPAGSNTQVQYNASGSFGASSAFAWTGDNALLIQRSHTEAYSAAVAPSNPGLVVENPVITSGLKYAAIQLKVKGGAAYDNIAYIAVSAESQTSHHSRLNLMVRNAAGSYLTPLYVDGVVGAVLQDINNATRFQVTTTGATVTGDLTVSDSGVNFINIKSTTASDVYLSVWDSIAIRGVIGWDYSLALLKFNYGTIGSNHFTMNSAGHVGIGTGPTGDARFYVQHSTSGDYVAYFDQTNTGGYGIRIDIESDSAGFIQRCYNGATPTLVAELRYNGDWWAGDYLLSSDIRHKKDIRSVYDGLDIALQLHPVSYGLRNKGGRIRYIGFLAQEVKSVRPELVKEVDGYLALSYHKITAINNSAIHKLHERISYLEDEIKKLKDGNGT